MKTKMKIVKKIKGINVENITGGIS